MKSWKLIINFTGYENTFKRVNSDKIVLSPFGTGILSKSKELAPLWSKFFPFRKNPFENSADPKRSKFFLFWVNHFSEGLLESRFCGPVNP